MRIEKDRVQWYVSLVSRDERGLGEDCVGLDGESTYVVAYWHNAEFMRKRFSGTRRTSVRRKTSRLVEANELQ